MNLNKPDALPAAIVIGRNEGARLVRCLQSLQGRAYPIVYVDSGSSDGSVEAARALGSEVVALDMRLPFTAARARNAGRAHLASLAGQPPEFLQFVDGDCEVAATWCDVGMAFLSANPRFAVACGRRRERHPDVSTYNRLCDLEWDTPIGETLACGGDALIRTAAFDAVSGFNPALIAGEEPELCLRLRAQGWHIQRLDAEMTLHDASMLHFSQWWTRAVRCGHAFAEGAALHGSAEPAHWVRETRRALLWGALLPITFVLLAAAGTGWALGLFIIYPLQVVRLFMRGRRGTRNNALQAVFHTLARFPEAQGALTYHYRRLTAAPARLIEYK